MEPNDDVPGAALAALRARLEDFMAERVYPAETSFAAQSAAAPWGRPPLLDALRSEARQRGLFHLFSATRSREFPFSTVELAQLAEVTGRSPLLAQDALGSLNPDAEVINLLHRAGTPEQKQQWLAPLLNGEIGSALCITEPDVASSDPSALATAAREDGASFVVSGDKAWALGALSPICRLLVVLALTDPGAPARRRHSLVLVPHDAPGVQIAPSASVFGYRNEVRGGMPRVSLASVQVPLASLLGPRGAGLATLQTALGPARLFHCMRLVGAAERALALMCERLSARKVRNAALVEHGLWMDRVAEARIRIEQARALSLAAAARIDAEGLEAAAPAISLAKAAVPASLEWVMDMAIQAFGSDGLSHELPLAYLWTFARTLRFSDGPDEAHRMAIARAELKRRAVHR